MKYIKKINELNNLDFYDKVDRLAIYAAEKYFFMDSKKLRGIGGGSEGYAYTDGDKVIKITRGREEAERAERLRGKSARNLMTYYSVHEIEYYGQTYWALQMDLLPNIVAYTTPYASIYVWLHNRFGSFNVWPDRDITKIQQNREDLILNTRKRDRMGSVKRAVDLMYRNRNILSRVKNRGLKVEDIREITYNMLYDLINMNFEMKKFGISNDDLHAANLGITKDGRIVYFDIGFDGTGMKKIGDNKRHIVKDVDTDQFRPTFENIEMINESNSRDKLAAYLAYRYFHYDKGDIKLLGSGTKGYAYEVDNGKKVLKLTKDEDEAGRAERTRTKYTDNIISYYDVRRVKSNTYGDWYVLLMDKLPHILETYREGGDYGSAGLDIYHTFVNRYGDIAYDHTDMPGSDIKDYRELKRYINKMVNNTDPKEYLWDGYDKELVSSMWLDMIKIRRQLRKFGIVTNDITTGNLGFTKDGKMVFFDMGYGGEGNKEIKRKSAHLKVDDIPRSGIYAIGQKYLKQFGD